MVDEQTGDLVCGHDQGNDSEEGKDSDSDFECDDDVYYRDLKDQRIAQMKAETEQKM